MKKAILSWSLVFLLGLVLLPSAYAAEGNLGTATINEYYSCTVYGAASDTALTVVEGSALPPGFALEGNMLCGTPTQVGDFDFTVSDGVNSIHCTLSVLGAEDPNEIISIAVNTAPAKLQYSLGDQLDTAGLLIDVMYADGRTEKISEGFGYYPMQLDAVGVIPIEVSYQGLKCYFNVTVTDTASQIGGIGLVTLPSKTEYKPGEEFIPSGIVLRVYRLDKSHYDIDSGYTYAPSILEIEGEQTITLSYEGKSCTFTVKVAKDDQPSALYIASFPAKVNYMLGESLNTDGLKLRQTMSSGAEHEITSGFSCSPVVLNTVGQQRITVTYGKLSCAFSVTVSDSTPSPSPTPSPTPTPTPLPSATPSVSPSPSPTAHIVEHQSHSTGANVTFLVVILILAALLLLGLIAYVYTANHGGIEAVKKQIEQFLKRFRK